MADYWCWSTCSTQSLKHTDIAGGITAGYNYQVDDNFVVGLEADFGSGAKSHTHFDDRGTDPIWRYDYTAKQKWNATLRGRAGVALNKTLLYVTGGLDLDDSDFTSLAVYGTSGTYSDDYVSHTSSSRTGYVYGAGVEHKFNERISLKAEYLHSEFGQTSACYRYRGESAPNFATCADTGTTDSTQWNSANDSLRVGINYHF
jgi:opacity protein-like surface antigen